MTGRLAAPLALVLVLMVAQAGQAQMIMLGQDRRAQTSALVVGEFESDNDQQSDVAPDTGPFDVSQLTQAIVPDAEATAESVQGSVLSMTSIQAHGSAGGQASLTGGAHVAYASASSNIALRFIVEFERAYSIQGFLEESGSATATFQLSRPFQTVAWFSANDETLDVNQGGILEPGTYDLNITCSGGAAADASGTDEGAASYDLAFVLSSPTDVPGRPVVAEGLRAHPNPFRASTRLSLPEAVEEVRVLDAGGRLVRTLAGAGTAVWDGRDEAGRPLASGVYWLQPIGASSHEAVRVIRLR